MQWEYQVCTLAKFNLNIKKGCLPIAKLDLIGWEKYDAGLSLVNISISILSILKNIEGQQLKDQLLLYYYIIISKMRDQEPVDVEVQ